MEIHNMEHYIFSLLKNNRLEHLLAMTHTREMDTESEEGPYPCSLSHYTMTVSAGSLMYIM